MLAEHPRFLPRMRSIEKKPFAVIIHAIKKKIGAMFEAAKTMAAFNGITENTKKKK